MVASFPVMVLAGRFADRVGCRPLLVVSAACMGVGLACLYFVESFATLFSSLLLLSAASGAYDVGANAAAIDYERATGLKRMVLIHAAFSAGGALGALFAGFFLSSGVGFRLVYLAALVPLGVVAFGAAKARYPRWRDRRSRGKARRPVSTRTGPCSSSPSWPAWRSSRRRPWSTGRAPTCATRSRSRRSWAPRGWPSTTPLWPPGAWSAPGS